MTIYGANADSLSLTNYENESLKSVEVSNSDESTQIAVQLLSEIESFEIDSPKRKTLQFFLRNSQSNAKNSISIEKNINDFEEEKFNQSENEIVYKNEQKPNVNNVLIILGGIVVSAVDITNSASFAAGALIGIIGIFL